MGGSLTTTKGAGRLDLRPSVVVRRTAGRIARLTLEKAVADPFVRHPRGRVGPAPTRPHTPRSGEPQGVVQEPGASSIW